MNSDPRQYAPATGRNRKPILEVLLRVLPAQGDILEVASGTGEHAVFFAPYFLPRQWIPSDPNPMLRESIRAWREYYQVYNLEDPLAIDVCTPLWNRDIENKDIKAMVCINMIHIAPWSACLGLMEGAKEILPSQGILYLYGPYKQGGEHTASSNVAFDQSLQAQNPAWGVRNLEDVVSVAQEQGLVLLETVSMPANNLSLIFQRQS